MYEYQQILTNAITYQQLLTNSTEYQQLSTNITNISTHIQHTQENPPLSHQRQCFEDQDLHLAGPLVAVWLQIDVFP
jgi:hypothetical protein